MAFRDPLQRHSWHRSRVYYEQYSEFENLRERASFRLWHTEATKGWNWLTTAEKKSSCFLLLESAFLEV